MRIARVAWGSIVASPQELLDNNRKWSERIRKEHPHFFTDLAKGQKPNYLWIGCADSREPANQVLDAAPGDIFVHRNISNLVLHTDMSCLAVMQFAVEVLKVEHILIVGHYGCGGVKAAMDPHPHGLIDNWLREIGSTLERHHAELAALPEAKRHARLCELNVIQQVANACHTTVVREAWARGQHLTVHGWCYALGDGLIRDLGVDVASFEALSGAIDTAIARPGPRTT